jgi:hypothetical protein
MKCFQYGFGSTVVEHSTHNPRIWGLKREREDGMAFLEFVTQKNLLWLKTFAGI